MHIDYTYCSSIATSDLGAEDIGFGLLPQHC